MKNSINRNPRGWNRLHFKNGKSISGKNFNIFLKKYNAHYPVRIFSSDYNLIKKVQIGLHILIYWIPQINLEKIVLL